MFLVFFILIFLITAYTGTFFKIKIQTFMVMRWKIKPNYEYIVALIVFILIVL